MAAVYRFTTRATSVGCNGRPCTWPPLRIVWNSGPSSMPASSSQRRSLATGRSRGPLRHRDPLAAAELIRLRSSDVQEHPGRFARQAQVLHVGESQGAEFRTPERRGEAERHDCRIPNRDEPPPATRGLLVAAGQDPGDLARLKRLDPARSPIGPAPEPPQHGVDSQVVHG